MCEFFFELFEEAKASLKKKYVFFFASSLSFPALPPAIFLFVCVIF